MAHYPWGGRMLFRIKTIGRYEALNLVRSKMFPVFFIAAALLMALTHFLGITNTQWVRHGIPSSIPCFSFLYLNFLQAIAAVYLSSSFFSREKGTGSTESIAIRPFSNFEYLIGKLAGLFAVYAIVNFLILAVTFISNSIFLDVPVVLKSYAFYLLLIPLPSLIFISGLTYLLMSIVRHRPLVTVLLTAYIIATSLSLDYIFYSLLDFMGTNMPMLYSDFVGFGRLTPMIWQRLLYLCLGTSLFLASIPLYHRRRLFQSPRQNIAAASLAIVFLTIALCSGHTYYTGLIGGRLFRVALRDSYSTHAQKTPVDITNCDIRLSHEQREISASAGMTFINDSEADVDTLIFSLNPGLKVTSIQYHGREIPHTRDYGVIETVLPKALETGRTDSLVITYHGFINEEACYIDIDENIRVLPRTAIMIGIDKRYAFITPEYLLLTREALWYPIAGVPSSPEHPASGKDFARFSLDFTTRPGLTAISQGAVTVGSDGHFRFTPEYPLSHISLVAGDYEKKAVTLEGIEYAVYFQRGRDFFSHHFSELGGKLPSIISDLKQRFEFQTGLDYPYSRFYLIETPIQFLTFERDWTLANESVQPEMLLLPEKGILLNYFNLSRSKKRIARIYRNEAMSPAEIEEKVFRTVLKLNFLDKMDFNRQRRRYFLKTTAGKRFPVMIAPLDIFNPDFNVLPMYNSQICSFKNTNGVDIGKILELYHLSKLEHRRGGMSTLKGDIMFDTSYDIARRALKGNSVAERANDPAFSSNMYDILLGKSEQFILILATLIGQEKLDRFIADFYREHRFMTIDDTSFITAFNERFGIDIKETLHDMFHEKGLPAYMIKNLSCHEFTESGKTRYQLLLTIDNAGETGGVFKVSLHPLGKNTQDDVMMRYIRLEPGMSKEIGWVFDEQPHDAVFFSTMLSANIPGRLVEHFPPIVKEKTWTSFEGERSFPTPEEKPPEGTILVDNSDTEFRIAPFRNASLLGRFLPQKNLSVETDNTLDFLHPPKQWNTYFDFHFHGSGPDRTGCMIRAGKGAQYVTWTAEIPENGRYDVYYYFPNFSNQLNFLRKHPKAWRLIIFDDFNFTMKHAQGSEHIQLKLKDEDGGWKRLGTWEFNAGKAELTMSNRSRGEIVIADAVKWVKR